MTQSCFAVVQGGHAESGSEKKIAMVYEETFGGMDMFIFFNIFVVSWMCVVSKLIKLYTLKYAS